MKVSSPLYLVGKEISCWKCNSKMSAVGLLAPENDEQELEGEFPSLMDITVLPKELEKQIQSRVPSFEYRFSNTVGYKYYANVCESCDMISGDFFLHSEPGGPFFPYDEAEAKELYMIELALEGSVEIDCSYHIGSGKLILNHARKNA